MGDRRRRRDYSRSPRKRRRDSRSPRRKRNSRRREYGSRYNESRKQRRSDREKEQDPGPKFINFREENTGKDYLETLGTGTGVGSSTGREVSCKDGGKAMGMSEYEKRQLEERKQMGLRTREKLRRKNKDVSGKKTGSLMQRLLKSANNDIKKAAVNDKDLTKIRFRSLEKDEEKDDAMYSMKWSDLSNRIEKKEERDRLRAAMDDVNIESVASFQLSKTHSNHKLSSAESNVNDSHCQAIFSNPLAKPEPKPEGEKARFESTGRKHMSSAEKLILRQQTPGLRRAGIGALTTESVENQVQRRNAAVENWEREREREWKKNKERDGDDASSWGSSSQGSDAYVNIERKKYHQDLRAESLQGSDSDAAKSGSKSAVTGFKKKLLGKGQM